MKFEDSVVIKTDEGWVRYGTEDYDTVEECIEDYFDGQPLDSMTPDGMRAYLSKLGGFGWLEVDDEIIMEVK